MNYSWTPQAGTQLKAITATWCPELFFGGARGGGKSDFLLGDFAQDVNVYKENWHGILFRKIAKELDELIKRSYQIFTPMGAIFKVQEKKWIFPNGATLRLAFLEKDQDADKFQGLQFTWIGFDELPNWLTDVCYNKLKACLRSPHNIPFKRIRASGNPGGVGQGWVKERFIDAAPKGFTPLKEVRYINIDTGAQLEEKDGDDSLLEDRNWRKIENVRMFIPSRLEDNKILMDNDPFYIARLAQSGGKELVKAWLAGDWDAIEGAYFDGFDKNKHIVEPFFIPPQWARIRGFDWGYSKPFCVLWAAVSDGSQVLVEGEKRTFPSGSLIFYREYYGTTGKPNEGLKINASEIAKNILEMEEGEEMNDVVADPSIFETSHGESYAEEMFKFKVYWRPADNKRIAGWQQIRSRLVGEDDKPLIYYFSSCKNLIRTMPIQQYDKSKPEDLDSDLEDHAVDTERYICMSRPITIKIPPTLQEVGKQWMEDFNPHNVTNRNFQKALGRK
jgi:hypothetical protein